MKLLFLMVTLLTLYGTSGIILSKSVGRFYLGKACLKFKDEIQSLLKLENTFKENEFENGYRSDRLDVAIP
jgi:hypothetical protein